MKRIFAIFMFCLLCGSFASNIGAQQNYEQQMRRAVQRLTKEVKASESGQNFRLTNEPNKRAFLTGRFVEAADEREAKRIAPRVAPYEPDDAPRVVIERVQEIAEFPENAALLSGVIFYDERQTDE